MNLGLNNINIAGPCARAYYSSKDASITREIFAETMDGTDIKDKFEKNPTDKKLFYTDTIEIRDEKGRIIRKKQIRNTPGEECKIINKNQSNELRMSAKLDKKGNRISTWKVDFYEDRQTNIIPETNSIHGLPKKISDLPAKVQKVYIDFFEKCEKLLNEYRKEQGMI